MATPIYKCARARLTEAWYQLSKTQQDEVFAKVDAALEQAGGKRVIFCQSDWSNERWSGFVVEEFPDIESVQKHTALLNEINWFRYIDSEHLLGTRIPE